MADWFKFFENDLDETRLQYAISKLPEVVSVYVGILSEACRNKSGTVRWGTNEIELFGFSRRLGISIPKVNEAVNMLVEIEYLKRGENTLIVLKWNEKQSEYCQKKSKAKTDTVGTVSGQCRDSVGLEERRGEEIEKKRGEEPERKTAPAQNHQSPVQNFPEAQTPSWKEFWDYCQQFRLKGVGLPEFYARDKFLAAEQENWARARNWRAYATRVFNWWNQDGKPSAPVKRGVAGSQSDPREVRGSMSHLVIPGNSGI